SRRRHTRFSRDWSSDVCSSDLVQPQPDDGEVGPPHGDGQEGQGHVAGAHRPVGASTLVVPLGPSIPAGEGRRLSWELGRGPRKPRPVQDQAAGPRGTGPPPVDTPEEGCYNRSRLEGDGAAPAPQPKCQNLPVEAKPVR